jgi:peptide-methionine (R)-S-oxide reductase
LEKGNVKKFLKGREKGPFSLRDARGNNPFVALLDCILKKIMKWFIPGLLIVLAFTNCGYSQTNKKKQPAMENSSKSEVYSKTDTSRVELRDEDWKKLLTPEQYYIARMKGTERPWTSKFERFDEVGLYRCVACGNALFRSNTKFDSGCGWPSFYEPVSKTSIIYTPDNSHGMQRTEVQCGRCKAHLGHVFDDGPPPTGLRYCINGVILDFEKEKK